MRSPRKVVKNLDVDESATSDVATRARLHNLVGRNKNAAVLYLKLYDKATAATVGTDVPKLTIPVGPGLPIPPLELGEEGLIFASGISMGATTGLADDDVGAPGANDLIVNLFYS